MSTPLADPGPERRAQLEALGMRVSTSDFTPEEIADADESAQRALDAMAAGRGTTVPS